ncbi:MAG: hypothetical protein AAF725_22895 [Acidobacteriota bacterium]
MNDTQDIFEAVNTTARDIAGDRVGSTVHSNTHNHALVENPFAWDDQDEA